MKFPVKTAAALAVVAALGTGGAFLSAYWKERAWPRYREAEVTRGTVTAVVNATGTVQPENTVPVGSFVSGPVLRIHATFNDEVEENALLAEIDPQLYQANVDRDRALLDIRRAELTRAEVLRDQAVNDHKRAEALRKENKNFIADTEMDQFKFNRVSLTAQVLVAEKSVDQADANLKNSEANLGYTKIRSPVAGFVINRKIDKGQTVASQFQTPELFVVAPNMRTRMHVLASVDEADIGAIKAAQRRKLPVRFTVDAYPDDLFEGAIAEVRMNSTTTQNVVTYPVIVAAPNPELKLMPGMTAGLSFQTDEAADVLRVPNAALRYFPQPHQVRPEDRKLLEGGGRRDPAEDSDTAKAKRTAGEKAEARKNRSRRHVWVVDGEFLKAVEVVTGLSDNGMTQLVGGDLVEGQKLVTGQQTGP